MLKKNFIFKNVMAIGFKKGGEKNFGICQYIQSYKYAIRLFGLYVRTYFPKSYVINDY